MARRARDGVEARDPRRALGRVAQIEEATRRSGARMSEAGGGSPIRAGQARWIGAPPASGAARPAGSKHAGPDGSGFPRARWETSPSTVLSAPPEAGRRRTDL